jgi:hypothetical protein
MLQRGASTTAPALPAVPSPWQVCVTGFGRISSSMAQLVERRIHNARLGDRNPLEAFYLFDSVVPPFSL